MDRLSHAKEFVKNFRIKEYVYFIRCHDFVKIGLGRDPYARLGQLQIGNPYLLELIHFHACLDAVTEEKALHEKYGQKWERGEWFKLSEIEI